MSKHTVVHESVKASRVVVSVAFQRADFDRLAAHAEQSGKKVSAIIREAAIEEVRGATMPNLTVSPNPVAAGQSFTISGSGFRRNDPLVVCVWGMAPCQPVTTDLQGTFTMTYTRQGGLLPGAYLLQVWRGKGPRLAATLSFQVL